MGLEPWQMSLLCRTAHDRGSLRFPVPEDPEDRGCGVPPGSGEAKCDWPGTSRVLCDMAIMSSTKTLKTRPPKTQASTRRECRSADRFADPHLRHFVGRSQPVCWSSAG